MRRAAARLLVIGAVPRTSRSSPPFSCPHFSRSWNDQNTTTDTTSTQVSATVGNTVVVAPMNCAYNVAQIYSGTADGAYVVRAAVSGRVRAPPLLT